MRIPADLSSIGTEITPVMNETKRSVGEPIAIFPERPAPALPGTVVVSDSVEELVETMSRDLLAHSLNCVRSFGDFHMALSGGRTPVPFYRHLMIDPNCRGIPWRKTHLWQVAETISGGGDDDNDDFADHWSVVSEYLADHSGIPNRQLHPMRKDASTLLEPEAYEADLRRVLEWRERGHDRLDFVLLGVDESGTTAGLVPEFRSSLGQDRLVISHRLVNREAAESWRGSSRNDHGRSDFADDRITMTYRLINSARFVAVMVTGSRKREIIRKLSSWYVSQTKTSSNGSNRQIMHRDDDFKWPVCGVKPLSGMLRWYLDRSACPTE